MKWERLARTILICTLAAGGCAFLASCGSKEAAQTTTTGTTTVMPITTQTTAETTPSVPAISGPLPTNAVGATPTWTETAIDPAKTMYVDVVDFLRIRKGPSQDFEQVGSLTDGMAITVVAKTDANWYKLLDGYYVSGDFLTETP